MRFIRIVLILILLSDVSRAQNFPACDSLIIDCCAYDSLGVNTISMQVTNYSSVLFDYPAFIIFDSNMDTIAIETVTYFGIGNSPQPHTLNIVAPLNLPFSGFLNLYTLFYDTLACSFPFTIPDTVTAISAINEVYLPLTIFPNPALNTDVITFEATLFTGREINVRVVSAQGEVKNMIPVSRAAATVELNVKDLIPGLYLLRVEDAGIFYSEKLLKL